MRPHDTVRRAMILGLPVLAALGGSSLAVGQTTPTSNRRLVVVILRGGLDGLAAVAPYGDRTLAALRPDLILPEPRRQGGLLDLGGFFGLHPAMPNLHSLYRAGQAAIVHAVAGAYRTRSHFMAQDLMESGATQRLTSGWLNRALAFVPDPPDVRAGFYIGDGLAHVMRGPTQVSAFEPSMLSPLPTDLRFRIRDLYNGHELASAMDEGLRARGYTSRQMVNLQDDSFANLCRIAGTLLLNTEGPRVIAMEMGGFDTHINQNYRLVETLGSLDTGLGELKSRLGASWAHSTVLVMTEFGRTVRGNANGGTDHGTAGVAFLCGGAVAGGRVIGAWPGLARDQLLEGRDLAPTTDMRAVCRSLLRDHMRLGDDAVNAAFPGTSSFTNGLFKS